MNRKVKKSETTDYCWAHARRDYADAVKAMKKDNPQAVKTSVASQGLKRIATIYALEGALSDLSVEERLQERQKTILPLVNECLKTGFSMKIVFLKLKFNHGSHDMIRQGDNAGRFFGGVLFMV